MKLLTLNKLNRFYLFSFFLLGLVCFNLQLPAHAQTQNSVGAVPLQIISDKMIAQQDTSMVEFIGNVKVTRIDSTIFADSIKIFFSDEKQKNSQSNVSKIISTGNVKYTAGERKAFADKAIFTTQDEILILTGKSPKLITGSSFVTGKKITLFKKQDKVIVESDGSNRVEAVFNPEDTSTEKP